MLLRLALIFACQFTLANFALAQDDDLDGLPSSSETVQIEVLVFRFPGKGAGAELKAGQAPASNIGQAILTASNSAAGSDHYSEIEPNQRQLSGAMARIQASSDLKPLLFTAWRQNLSDARWVSLQPRGTEVDQLGAEKITGRLLLTPGKPLGLKLELQLDGAQIDSVQTNVSGNSSASARFRMRANRPAHFEETLYFDHPALGALVRVDLSPQ